jgi:hypothetical protein
LNPFWSKAQIASLERHIRPLPTHSLRLLYCELSLFILLGCYHSRCQFYDRGRNSICWGMGPRVAQSDQVNQPTQQLRTHAAIWCAAFVCRTQTQIAFFLCDRLKHLHSRHATWHTPPLNRA